MTDTYNVCRFINLSNAMEILKKENCTGLTREVLEQGIKQGIFEFGKCIELDRNKYLISEAKLYKFIEENTMTKKADPGLLEFERTYGVEGKEAEA